MRTKPLPVWEDRGLRSDMELTASPGLEGGPDITVLRASVRPRACHGRLRTATLERVQKAAIQGTVPRSIVWR
jgi:hypothetical protein